MGFLSNVLRFIFPRQFLEELAEEITPLTPAAQFFERIEREQEEKEEDKYVRKIVKTGKSVQGYRNLFAFTFEDNDTDRKEELTQAIEDEYDIELDPDDIGYDDSSITTNSPPFVWDEIEVGKE